MTAIATPPSAAPPTPPPPAKAQPADWKEYTTGAMLDDPTFLRHLGELSRPSDLVWLIGMSTGLICTLIAAYPFSDTQNTQGNFWAYACLLVRGAMYLWAGDAIRGRGGVVLQRLFGVGVVAGLFELLVDYGLVHWVHNGKLVYDTGNDIVLLASPVWMPLAWACVIVEMGYPALRIFGLLRTRVGRAKAHGIAVAISGVSAGIFVGVYEKLAYHAGWWHYLPANAMIGKYCAVFIPLGEFFMFLYVLRAAARVLAFDTVERARVIVAGFLFACAIAGGYIISYMLLEFGRPVT